MPYKIEFSEKDGGVVTTYWGAITDEEIAQSGREKASKGYDIGMIRYFLTDLSLVEKFSATPAGIQENASFSSGLLKGHDKIFVVFVFPTDLEYGMGRIWQAYAEHADERIKIFKSRSDADAWIAKQLAPAP